MSGGWSRGWGAGVGERMRFADRRRLAAQAPALLESMDLSAGRAVTLVRAAREVASGRVDLYDGDHEAGWRRLRAIRGSAAGRSRCWA